VYRILESIQRLPISSNAVLKETQIFHKPLIVTFMAIIVYRVSWLFARAILCFGAELGGRNIGAMFARHAPLCSAVGHVRRRREADERLLDFGCPRALLRFRTLLGNRRQRGVHPGPL
jgi:hypothetical protein